MQNNRIAFVHCKGGTGKTTSCISLAGWLSKMHQRVLVIDLDPQANATSGLGVDLNTVETSLYHVLTNQISLSEIILSTESGVYLAPATVELLSVESELSRQSTSPYQLKLEVDKISSFFNFILVDCPPGANLLMINGIVATENIIIPLDSSAFSYETLNILKTVIFKLEKELKISVNIMMTLLKKFSPFIWDLSQTTKMQKMLNEYFESLGVYNNPICTIPFSKKILNAQMRGQPISHFAPNSRASRVYERIAKDILGQNLI